MIQIVRLQALVFNESSGISHTNSQLASFQAFWLLLLLYCSDMQHDL